MALNLSDAGPGDLITSEAWNSVLKAIRGIDERVAILEAAQTSSSGKLAIREIYPLDIEIGKELHIIGVNFGAPMDNTVTFDGVPASVIFKQPPSSDQVLVFDIPPISMPGDSKPVVLTVSNSRGYDSRQITVRKAVATIPDGSSAIVKFIKAMDASPGAGTFHVLQFSIDGSNTLDETYTLRLESTGNITARPVTDPTGTTELVPPAVQIAALKPGSLTTSITAYVRVDIPSGATGAASVKLTADSQHNPGRLSGSASPLSFTIGSAAWPGTPTITFQRIGVSGPGATFDPSTGTVSFTAPTPANTLCWVTLTAHGLRAGVAYTAKLAWDVSPNGWTASLLGNPLDPKWPLLTLPVSSPSGGSADISVYLLAASGAGTGTFVLSMSADTDPTDTGKYLQIVKPTTA